MCWPARLMLDTPADVVGTSSWAHHVAMDEFADHGHQSPDDLWALRPASPAPRPRPPDPPVRVRIVWDAGIPPPVAGWLGQDDRGLLGALASPKSGAWQVRDFTKSAAPGFVLDIPAQRQIALRKGENVIMVLLGHVPRPADWAGRVPAAPARPVMSVPVRIVWDAGITCPPDRGLGRAEWHVLRSLENLGPGPRTVRDVQYVDFMLSAGNGFVVDSQELPQIAVGKTADAINVLLIPAPPDPDPDPDHFLLRPHHDMGPFGCPVRDPGSEFEP